MRDLVVLLEEKFSDRYQYVRQQNHMSYDPHAGFLARLWEWELDQWRQAYELYYVPIEQAHLTTPQSS